MRSRLKRGVELLIDQLRPAPSVEDVAAIEARTYAIPDVVASYAASADDGLFDPEAEIAARYLRSGTRTLDVGCGQGREAIGFARRGAVVTGIDVCPAAVEGARRAAERAGVAARFEVASLLDFPAPDASFDVVYVAADVYARTPGQTNRVAALARCRRALRPGGALIVSVSPAPARPWVRRLIDAPRRLARWLGGSSVPEPGDRRRRDVSENPEPRFLHRFFSDAEVADEFRQAGFPSVDRLRGHFAATVSDLTG
jgi:SAM-dependent methyltransferase